MLKIFSPVVKRLRLSIMNIHRQLTVLKTICIMAPCGDTFSNGCPSVVQYNIL